MSGKFIYIPVARLTYDMEAANACFRKSLSLLSNLGYEVTVPDEILTSPEDVDIFMASQSSEFSGVIFQHITFADGEFVKTVAQHTNAPVIIWCVKEPSIGGRLRQNSLTGVMSSCNYLKNNNRPYLYIMENGNDDQLKTDIVSCVKTASTYAQLSSLVVGIVGSHPSGFFFSDSDPQQLTKHFGVKLKKYSLEDVFEKSENALVEDYNVQLDYAYRKTVGFDKSDECSIKFAKITSVLSQIIDADHLGAIAMRCWPDYFVEMDVAPCAVFSQLTEQGTPTSCESDIHGTLSMYLLQQLTQGNTPYLGDVVNVLPENNSIILWHCGFGGYSLANEKTGASLGIHPNRKIGPVMDFALKPGIVTLFRISYINNKYKFIIVKGSAEDTDPLYNGTSVEIKLKSDVSNFVNSGMKEGYEPHFTMVHGDVSGNLADIANMLNIEAVVF